MTKGRTAYTVMYNSENHWSVLTQMHGSKWPAVLPYCMSNVGLMVLLTFIDKHFQGKYSIEISNQGHSFITLIVAFLLVSRVTIAYGRYQQARDCLGTMYRESRELVQNACVFSGDSLDQKAQEWRNELGYRCLLLLRTAMAVIDYPVTHTPAWDVPELTGFELDDVKRSTYLNVETRRWAHAERNEYEESMRVPIRIAYLLRKTIHSQSKRLKNPIQIGQENKLLSSVDGFMNGYYGIRRFLTTPVPFPLVQMSRTFLFLYVFTVPFVMLSDNSSLFAHCFAVFLITYGFVGLELVSIELDNPFGDDPNDFDNAGLAAVSFEDSYLTILDVDGSSWADNLRYRMHDKSSEPLPSEQSWLLTKIV